MYTRPACDHCPYACANCTNIYLVEESKENKPSNVTKIASKVVGILAGIKIGMVAAQMSTVAVAVSGSIACLPTLFVPPVGLVCYAGTLSAALIGGAIVGPVTGIIGGGLAARATEVILTELEKDRRL